MESGPNPIIFEEFAGVHCQVDIASEFRYSNKVVLENSLLITISQSGETADTIAALKNTLELMLNLPEIQIQVDFFYPC